MGEDGSGGAGGVNGMVNGDADMPMANGDAHPDAEDGDAATAAAVGAGIQGERQPNKVRVTTPYLTKYERARILGTRALQIRCVRAGVYYYYPLLYCVDFDPLFVVA